MTWSLLNRSRKKKKLSAVSRRVGLRFEQLEDRLTPAGPTVTLTAPADGSFTNSRRPTFTATATDPSSAIASVQFQYSTDGGATWITVGSATSAPYSVTPTSDLPEGNRLDDDRLFARAHLSRLNPHLKPGQILMCKLHRNRSFAHCRCHPLH